jgi:peptide/nickel transport system substrate-binding protein
MNRRKFIKSVTATTVALGGSAATGGLANIAHAQNRRDTMMLVSEGGPNNFDIQGVGTNRPGYEVAWNCYDRLISHGFKTLDNGVESYDKDKFTPELAEEWTAGPMSVTFKLRKDATFHDGTPVTARDVKWSFDRAVTVGGFPTFTMKVGSLEKPEQFVVVDDHTFRIDLIRKDRLSLPVVATIVPSIMHSEQVKKHATDKDPWGLEYTKTNIAGGGAYKVAKWAPGSELVYERFEGWRSGKKPDFARIIWRIVPSAGTRRALMERGDADLSFDLPAKDYVELKQLGKLNMVSTPISNGIQYIGMNTTKPPFDNPKVRQAVAYAIPYQKIMDAVLYGMARPLFGASTNAVTTSDWPQSHAYNTDIAKAKQLLTEAGHAQGFDTVLSYDLGAAAINEPLSVLVQESLAQIGIRATINKVPGANWRGALLKKEMPMISNFFSGWLDYADYFFYWCYHGQNAVFNTMGYQNAEMDRLINTARTQAAAGDMSAYDTSARGFIDLAFDDVPRVPLYQPELGLAMKKDMAGYRFWFHRQLDYRSLVRV